jgi:hypothetical protein
MPSGGPGLRGTLVGCANADAVRLTRAERTKCNERFGMEMDVAPRLDSMTPARRAAFDRENDRNEAGRRYRNSTTDTNNSPTEPGGIAHGPASTESFPHSADEPN